MTSTILMDERGRSPAAAVAAASSLTVAAGAVAAVTIVLYQSWFMPFFQSFFAGRVGLARVVFYSLYGSLLLTAASILITRTDLWKKIAPFAIVAALGLAATVFHPIGLVTRAYIIATVMGGLTMVLMAASSPVVLLQLSAAVTALNAALCFVDLLFADGFTSTVGRAAGLAINPNVAAAGILLGAAASHRAVPRRLQLSFIALVAGSLVITLSRSTILAALAAVAIPAAVGIAQRIRAGRPLVPKPDGVLPAALVTAAMIACVGVSIFTNRWVGPVVRATVAASLSAVGALEDAHDSVMTGTLTQSAPLLAADPGATPSRTIEATAISPAAPPVTASAPPSSGPKQIAALNTRLSDEGVRNTISARTLFLERAMLAYRSNGFFGMGLEAAHPLVPHNMFVLFALAFGHLGWLIPIAVVALAVHAAHDARDLPLAVAAAGTMLTSHDILLTPSLFLPIAIGLGGMIARGHEGEPGRNSRGIALGAAAGIVLFAAGCVVIVRFASDRTVEPLKPGAITPYRGAYLVSLPPQTFPGLLVPAIGAGPRQPAIVVSEDSRPLTEVEWNTRARPAVAPGEYVFRDGALIFAPTDASDPRGGAHVFELTVRNMVGPLFYVLMAILAASCAAVMVVFGRTARPAAWPSAAARPAMH